MLQGITLVQLGMELEDKRKLLLLSLYTVSFLALIYYISNHYSCEEKLSYINFIFMDVNNQLVSALSRLKCYNPQEQAASYKNCWRYM